jgi:hypothetical protein
MSLCARPACSFSPAEREARIIMLYHTIAMAVVALQVYFITPLSK